MRQTIAQQCLITDPHSYHGWSEIGEDDENCEEFFYVCLGVPRSSTSYNTTFDPPIVFEESSEDEPTINDIRARVGLPPYFGEEVRTTSSTGGQKGVKPERYSLIPVEALDI